MKYVNFNHFMPTRYLLKQEQLDTKGLIKTFESHSNLKKEGEPDKQKDPLSNLEFKASLRKEIKKHLEEKYQKVNLNDSSPDNLLIKFLFKPLRF